MRSPFSKDVSLRKETPSVSLRETPQNSTSSFRGTPPRATSLRREATAVPASMHQTNNFGISENQKSSVLAENNFCLPPEGGGVFVRKCRKELPFSNELCDPAHPISENHIKPPPTAGNPVSGAVFWKTGRKSKFTVESYWVTFVDPFVASLLALLRSKIAMQSFSPTQSSTSKRFAFFRSG